MVGVVVPLVGTDRSVVLELIAGRLPCLAAVVRPLHDLAEPSTRLSRIEPVGISGRGVHVVNIPAREVRPFDLPVLTPLVGSHHERALVGSYQHTNLAHTPSSTSRSLTPNSAE